MERAEEGQYIKVYLSNGIRKLITARVLVGVADRVMNTKQLDEANA